MKRSKVFLALTTLVLAVVAFASAKHNRRQIRVCYFTPNSPAINYIATIPATTVQFGSHGQATVNGGYLAYTLPNCLIPMYTGSN